MRKSVIRLINHLFLTNSLGRADGRVRVPQIDELSKFVIVIEILKKHTKICCFWHPASNEKSKNFCLREARFKNAARGYEVGTGGDDIVEQGNRIRCWRTQVFIDPIRCRDLIRPRSDIRIMRSFHRLPLD